MDNTRRVLVVGAAGNLGSHLCPYLIDKGFDLRFLVHKSPLSFDVTKYSNTEVVQGDLAKPETLSQVCDGIDDIIYIAGILFKPKAERFLQKTNVQFVKNLVEKAKEAQIKRFILISFPHVMGESTPENLAGETLDGQPTSIHARTRLEAEKILIGESQNSNLTALILRCGIIYGKNLKLIQGARFLSKYKMLATWNRPTWIHLLAIDDFIGVIELSLNRKDLEGIYNVGDDEPILLKDFLDRICIHWGRSKPWRLPLWVFKMTTYLIEHAALIFHTATPLNQDILQTALTSSVADTKKLKNDLGYTLLHPSIESGKNII